MTEGGMQQPPSNDIVRGKGGQSETNRNERLKSRNMNLSEHFMCRYVRPHWRRGRDRVLRSWKIKGRKRGRVQSTVRRAFPVYRSVVMLWGERVIFPKPESEVCNAGESESGLMYLLPLSRGSSAAEKSALGEIWRKLLSCQQAVVGGWVVLRYCCNRWVPGGGKRLRRGDYPSRDAVQLGKSEWRNLTTLDICIVKRWRHRLPEDVVQALDHRLRVLG